MKGKSVIQLSMILGVIKSFRRKIRKENIENNKEYVHTAHIHVVMKLF